MTLAYIGNCFDGNPGDSFVRERPMGSACNTFKAVSPGLSGTPGTISLESALSPGYFLRHQGSVVKLHDLTSPSSQEQLDASFFPVESVDNPGWYQFQSENFPTHKIARNTNQGLNIVTDDGSTAFAGRSLFVYHR